MFGPSSKLLLSPTGSMTNHTTWRVTFICNHSLNREYLAPQIRSMNNRFNSEAKLPWSYDYPSANYIATNKSSANREMPLFSRLYPSFGYLRKIVQPRCLKYSLLPQPSTCNTPNGPLVSIPFRSAWNSSSVSRRPKEKRTWASSSLLITPSQSRSKTENASRYAGKEKITN